VSRVAQATTVPPASLGRVPRAHSTQALVQAWLQLPAAPTAYARTPPCRKHTSTTSAFAALDGYRQGRLARSVIFSACISVCPLCCVVPFCSRGC